MAHLHRPAVEERRSTYGRIEHDRPQESSARRSRAVRYCRLRLAAARLPGGPVPVRDLQYAGPCVHHRPDQRLGVREPRWRHALAVPQHQRAAQWTRVRPPGPRPIPARRVRARQPRPIRELHPRLPVSLPAAGLPRDHRRHHRRELPQRLQLRRERWPGHRPSRAPQAVSRLEQHRDTSPARQGRPEPHLDRGPFSGRRGRGPRLVLQQAGLGRAASSWTVPSPSCLVPTASP
jgi:hypothetical protein